MSLKKEVIYNAVLFDVYRGFGFLSAEDLGNMFRFKRNFENYSCGIRNHDFILTLYFNSQSCSAALFVIWVISTLISCSFILLSLKGSSGSIPISGTLNPLMQICVKGFCFFNPTFNVNNLTLNSIQLIQIY